MSVQQRKNGETAFIFERNDEVRRVFLVGDFNGWDPVARRMVKAKDGTFRAKMKLAPGEYQFRFLVDGHWRDDATTEQLANPFGSTNSVVRVA